MACSPTSEAVISAILVGEIPIEGSVIPVILVGEFTVSGCPACECFANQFMYMEWEVWRLI
jgi:hypothetical protein